MEWSCQRAILCGWKQKAQTPKHDESMSSPITGRDSLLVNLLIDAHEERDLGNHDMPGSCIQVSLAPKDNGERVLIKLVGEFVDIMCNANSEHEKT